MAADITIPAENAEVIAHILRKHGYGMQAGWIEPKPAPSLRDEVHAAIIHDFDHWSSWDTADAILAVMRRHVEALPVDGYPRPVDEYRDDVLRLLGASDE